MFKSIMVSCDRVSTCADRVALAAALAQKHDARLIGVGVRDLDMSIYSVYSDYAGAANLTSYADYERLARAEVAEVRRTFEENAYPAGQSEWREALTDPTRRLNYESRAADLLVIGRRGKEDEFDAQMSAHPGEVVLGSGCPVLVTPPGLRSLAPQSVVVAWKDSREARRALRDAIPFLSMAEEVNLIEITLGPETPVNGKDAAKWLSCHGVKAEAHSYDGPWESEAEALIEHARRFDADLIVSGGYGRSRLSELVFGGFTNDILQKVDLCCLLSN